MVHFYGFHVGKYTTWNAKCPIFLGNFTPKTGNYCLKNRALGFPGIHGWYGAKFQDHFPTLLTDKNRGRELAGRIKIIQRSWRVAQRMMEADEHLVTVVPKVHGCRVVTAEGGGDSPPWVPQKSTFLERFYGKYPGFLVAQNLY